MENRDPQALSQPQHVDSTHDVCLGRLYWVVLVVNRGCRGRQVIDRVNFDIEREGHIVTHELKTRVGEQMLDIPLRPGEVIVDGDDVVALVQEALGEVRANKTGSTGNQNSHGLDATGVMAETS